MPISETARVLRDSMKSEEALDRVEALEDTDLSASGVLGVVVEALSDPHELVRLSAAELLGQADHEDARTALRDLVAGETDNLAGAYGLSSLGQIGGPSDIGLLLDRLGAEVSPERRVHAAAGLAAAATRLANEAMVYYLTHESAAVRTMSAEALLATLVQVDPRILRRVQTAMEGEEDEDALEALAAILDLVDEDE